MQSSFGLCHNKKVADCPLVSRPLAAPGLVSYRCKNGYGWTMIGALDDEEALREARRSSEAARIEDLQVWRNGHYEPVIAQSEAAAA